MDFSTSTFEASENVFLFVFISFFVSFGVYMCLCTAFFEAMKNQTFEQKIFTILLIKRRSKARKKS